MASSGQDEIGKSAQNQALEAGLETDPETDFSAKTGKSVIGQLENIFTAAPNESRQDSIPGQQGGNFARMNEHFDNSIGQERPHNSDMHNQRTAPLRRTDAFSEGVSGSGEDSEGIAPRKTAKKVKHKRRSDLTSTPKKPSISGSENSGFRTARSNFQNAQNSVKSSSVGTHEEALHAPRSFENFLETQMMQQASHNETIAHHLNEQGVRLSDRIDHQNNALFDHMTASQHQTTDALRQVAQQVANLSTQNGKNSHCTTGLEYNHKNIAAMRRDPPTKHKNGTNMYSHLILNTDSYIRKYKFNKKEIAHCLSLVFEDSYDTALRAEEIALKYLDDPPTAPGRKSVYKKLVKSLGGSTSGQIEKLSRNEKIVDLFSRTKMSLEISSSAADDFLNYQAIQVMLDKDRDLMPKNDQNNLRQGFGRIRDFEDIEDSISTARVLKWLRNYEKDRIFERQNEQFFQMATATTAQSERETPESSAPNDTAANVVQAVHAAADTRVETQNTAKPRGKISCWICYDNSRFPSHGVENCPCKDKCTVCILVRGFNPDFVNHTVQQHQARPPRQKKWFGNQKDKSGFSQWKTNPQAQNPNNLPNVHCIDDLKYNPEQLNFVCALNRVDVDIGGRSVACFESADKRYVLLDILLPNGFMVEAKVDTAATPEGVVSRECVKKLGLESYLCPYSGSVEVANGSIVPSTQVLRIWVTIGLDCHELEFIVLENCHAGFLVGIQGLQKFGLDVGIEKVIKARNTSLRKSLGGNSSKN